MNIEIGKSWKKALEGYLCTPSFKELLNFIDSEYSEKTIYPPKKSILNAFNSTPMEEIVVIIIGQDPYHNPMQAHGLSFSVPDGIAPPPSLKNIYREIENDLQVEKNFSSGNLETWANQGVFLLNSVLTVEKNKPGSHMNKGWELFTDYIIRKISEETEHCVFLLWGNYAKKKGRIIDKSKHLVLESTHPSPFSAYKGFFGGRHFSKTNNYLKKYNRKTINW